jgi:hypothetical protein
LRRAGRRLMLRGHRRMNGHGGLAMFSLGAPAGNFLLPPMSDEPSCAGSQEGLVPCNAAAVRMAMRPPLSTGTSGRETKRSVNLDSPNIRWQVTT